ncbi:vWA domain-containing protein [Janibacter melonis]|uniref:vWA domain-containing protein n=1 Tax=Janibacter melonis TaxID=262209 RepID=UPI001F2B6002|nr:VWA domain-containing protein [Janibacter melonis]
MARRHRSRYGRYTGGPDPLAPPVDLGDALQAIGEDVMAGSSPERAMREYLRRGSVDQRGLDDLARRVAERRRELLEETDLGGTLAEIAELLESAVLAERGQLARDVDMDDTDRAFAQMRLDGLPDSPAAAVSELSDYEWRSPQARADFERIKDLLGREMLDQRFAGMKQALEGATEQDRQQVQEMLDDLGELLDKHAQGADTEQDFADFMAKHGDFFPEDPQDVDELIDALAARSAAAARMMASMTQEQRDELMQLSAQAFGSPQLAESLQRIDGALQSLRPGEDWSGSERFSGDQGVGLGDGTGVLQDLADLDALADQLAQAHQGARLDDVDLDALQRQLGDDFVVDARTLAELERALRDSGYLRRGADGELRLSPTAMRRLGQSLLKDATERLSRRTGQHDNRTSGAAGERTGGTREWQFGDTEPWDVTATVGNAVRRTAGEGGDLTSLRIDIRDVEVTETEARTRSAVALLVDTSFSMAMDGRWVPMKRTALALHQLVSTRFRGDDLQLIGFGRYARSMEIEELTGLDAMYDKGTNLHHGLLLANRFFRKHPASQPVLLVVTDGEPTAHLMPQGEPFFDYPPHPLTLSLTVTELETSRRLGAQTTFFRLGEDPGLARFVDSMARRVDGSVVAPELDDLGAAVVGSYLRSRTGFSNLGPEDDGYGRFGGGRFGGWYGDRGSWATGE